MARLLVIFRQPTTVDDIKGIGSLKKHFHIKDLGSMKYLSIEVARSKKDIILS